MEQTKAGAGLKDVGEVPLGSIEQLDHDRERTTTGNIFDSSKFANLMDKKDDDKSESETKKKEGEDESDELSKEDDPSWFFYHEKWT